jgi:DNA-binding transcriptional LysR family regulator
LSCTEFLNFQVVAVASPEHPMTRPNPSLAEVRDQTWLLGPSATYATGVVASLLRRINVTEERQRIFQSQAAAVQEAKRGKGIALAVAFAVAPDLAAGDLKRVFAQSLHAQGTWGIFTLPGQQAPPAAVELSRFVTTPRATQAMLRGTGVTPGRFQPSIHVTLWS